MGHVEDRWMKPGPTSPNGRPTRERTDRYGIGKRWVAVWHFAGTRHRLTFTTKDAADAHLAQVDVDQRAGTYAAPSQVTVAEYGDQWVPSQIHHRASTSEQLESRWRLHIRPALGDLRLTDVTRNRVQMAVIGWSKSLAPSTVAVTYAYCTALFKAAAADRIIRESPCQGIKLPKDEHERVVPLTVAQVHQIAGRVSPRYRGMVLLGAATGLRSGELRGLTVDRLAFDDGMLRVRVDRQLVATTPKWGPPKTSKSDRTVTVGEESAAMVRAHLAAFPAHGSGLVFTGREGGPLARTSMATAWGNATRGMGLPDRSGWHALRHHHASLLIAAGLSVTAVSSRLGHQDPTETLRTYAHLWADDEDRARAAVESALWEQNAVSLPSASMAG